MNRRILSFTLILLLSVFSVFATGEKEAEMEEGQMTFGVSLDSLFLGRQAEMMGVREVAEENNIELLESVADNDPQQQASQIRSFINQQVDLIMIVAVDNKAIMTSVNACEDAGIPVVTFDRKIPDADYVSYHAGLDSYADGEACGEYVAEQNPGDEELVVLELLGALNDSNAIQRRDGFNAALEGEDNLNIVQRPTEWNADKALSAVENAIVNYDNLWAIQIPSDFMQDSIKTALEEADMLVPVGEPGHIIVTTIDGAWPGYKAVVDGWTDGVAVLPLFELGRSAVRNGMRVAQGQSVSQEEELFPGTFYTYENIEENRESVWGYVMHQQEQ